MEISLNFPGTEALYRVACGVMVAHLGEIISATSYSEFTQIISQVISGITTGDLLLKVTPMGITYI